MSNPFVGWEKQCFGQYVDGLGGCCAAGRMGLQGVSVTDQMTFSVRLLRQRGVELLAANDKFHMPPSWFVEQWAELMEGK